MQNSTEIKVGALVLGALALLAVLVLVIGDFSFEDGQEIKVDYVFVGSLQPGAAVRSSGIKVGKVETIDFMGGQKNPKTGEPIQIRLTLWIEKRALNNVRQNSKFLINTEGMLGEQYVEIIPGPGEAPLLAAGEVIRGDDPPRTDLLMQKAFELIDVWSTIMVDNSGKLEQMLTSLDNLLRTSDQLLAKNKEEIGPLLENMNQLTAEMNKAMSQTGDVRAIIENTRVLTTELRENMLPMTRDMREAVEDLKIAGKNTVAITDLRPVCFPKRWITWTAPWPSLRRTSTMSMLRFITSKKRSVASTM
jgi:phospholipid/cholesterol/gamma-HCH transport system substrate-binding protein